MNQDSVNDLYELVEDLRMQLARVTAERDAVLWKAKEEQSELSIPAPWAPVIFEFNKDQILKLTGCLAFNECDPVKAIKVCLDSDIWPQFTLAQLPELLYLVQDIPNILTNRLGSLKRIPRDIAVNWVTDIHRVFESAARR